MEGLGNMSEAPPTDAELVERVAKAISKAHFDHFEEADMAFYRSLATAALSEVRAVVAQKEREAESALTKMKADRNALFDCLFDAIALIGHAMPMNTTALVAGETLVAGDVWNKGKQLLCCKQAALGASHAE